MCALPIYPHSGRSQSRIEIASGNRPNLIPGAPEACRTSGAERTLMARSGFLSIAISASTAMAAVITIGAPGAVAAAPKTHIVIIDKMKFGPTPINVRVGDVILWVQIGRAHV